MLTREAQIERQRIDNLAIDSAVRSRLAPEVVARLPEPGETIVRLRVSADGLSGCEIRFERLHSECEFIADGCRYNLDSMYPGRGIAVVWHAAVESACVVLLHRAADTTAARSAAISTLIAEVTTTVDGIRTRLLEAENTLSGLKALRDAGGASD